MPLDPGLVGRSSPPADTRIDDRWLMAYAAAVGATDPCYLDTRRPDGIVAHPLFPVCVEWVTGQGAMPPGPTGLTPAEAARGVHYRHELVLHHPVRAGTVRTTSSVVRVGRHRAGALMTTRIDAPAWTTWTTALFRDVDVAAPLDPVTAAPSTSGVVATASVPIPANAAHVYTECARIWNPIHTDAAVAHAAGLPGTILHGTATLAMAVTAIQTLFAIPPERVAGIAGQFGAMVLMPNRLTVRVYDSLRFDVLTADGRPAIRDGRLTIHPASG